MEHPPDINSPSFDCPVCGAFAAQRAWTPRGWRYRSADEDISMEYYGIVVTQCHACRGFAFWSLVGSDATLVHPRRVTAPLPHEDMPEVVQRTHQEARHVLEESPRAAAALLRLATEQLVLELGGEGADLSARIGDLVAKGLPSSVQKALDGLRVVGNHAVHPGQIDFQDNRGTALALFRVINLVVEQTLSRDRQIEQVYGLLTDAQLTHIKRRDGSSEE